MAEKLVAQASGRGPASKEHWAGAEHPAGLWRLRDAVSNSLEI